MHLLIHLRIRCVCHVDNDICIPDLLKRAFECLNKMMGKFPDKPYCVREKNLLRIIKGQSAGRCIERGEEHSVFHDPRICQYILDTALPGGSIPYQRRHFHP